MQACERECELPVLPVVVCKMSRVRESESEGVYDVWDFAFFAGFAFHV